jgi:hypothetical protein
MSTAPSDGPVGRPAALLAHPRRRTFSTSRAPCPAASATAWRRLSPRASPMSSRRHATAVQHAVCASLGLGWGARTRKTTDPASLRVQCRGSPLIGAKFGWCVSPLPPPGHGLKVLGLESNCADIGAFDVVAASCIGGARGKAHSAIQLRLGLQPVGLDLLAPVWACVLDWPPRAGWRASTRGRHHCSFPPFTDPLPCRMIRAYPFCRCSLQQAASAIQPVRCLVASDAACALLGASTASSLADPSFPADEPGLWTLQSPAPGAHGPALRPLAPAPPATPPAAGACQGSTLQQVHCVRETAAPDAHGLFRVDDVFCLKPAHWRQQHLVIAVGALKEAKLADAIAENHVDLEDLRVAQRDMAWRRTHPAQGTGSAAAMGVGREKPAPRSFPCPPPWRRSRLGAAPPA